MLILIPKFSPLLKLNSSLSALPSLFYVAMRGQGEMVELLVSKADDPSLALLTPNKEGLCTYHLALKAGNASKAQESALKMIDQLGGTALTACVMKDKKRFKDTPLLMAVGAHQDRVVRKMIELGVDVHQVTFSDEGALSRNLAR